MSRTAVVLAHSPPFRLGTAEVRPATREIIGPSGAEIVEPRVMQVLVALADANGEILSRDDLIHACWEGRIVSENAIDRVISKLRRLAGTTAGGSFHIETITKVGYRLLRDEAESTASPARLDSRPSVAGVRTGLDRRALILGGAALGIATASIWLGSRAARPVVPTAAAQLYERGVESLRRGWAEDMANAVSAFREAVTIAPDFADGWGMLALAYQLSVQFAPPETASDVHARARSASRRAFELDPGNAHALAAEALAVPIYRNWAAAETALRRVLDRDPAQLEARGALSRVLADVGRFRDGVATLERAGQAASALPFYQYWLAWLLFCADRLEESDRVIDRALGMWPRQFAIWFTRIWLYAYTGRATRALALIGDAANRPIGIPDRDFEIVELSVRAIMTRSPADIEAAVRANMAAAPAGAGFCTNAVKISAHLGRLDEAFAAAEALYFNRGFRVAPVFFTPQQGGYTPPEQRGTEFLFSPPCRQMHADPRFRDLLGEIGLADYWRSTGTGADAFSRS
ncbi:winged helix-turn-helix domain-containing protein [Sphingosinicella sp. YJ22]|uniref:winged helix-turn-helix domain-containing protein n=1 Tax=Sphingosinicella sp. YJ22 TaxID=1104780 RepID=UPI001408D355|nr:winged helix-turn-helix domain-containing protein [Sphingosinicella sp. YJ22]